MKPHVILIADAGGEIGWGHAVRQLALAEALVAKGVRTLFVSRTREALSLDWPCPVSFAGDDVFGHTDEIAEEFGGGPRYVVADTTDDLFAKRGMRGKIDCLPARVVAFSDYEGPRASNVVVDVHFGAAKRRSYGPAFLGPRFAPLRPAFTERAGNPRNEDRKSWVFTYGPCPDLPKPLRGMAPTELHAGKTIRMMGQCALALVPPSMVALECLCMGLPVVLYVPGPKWQPIADAMVAAGVAHIWDGKDYTLGRVLADDGERRRMAEAGREAVDGRGAERLAEWLA